MGHYDSCYEYDDAISHLTKFTTNALAVIYYARHDDIDKKSYERWHIIREEKMKECERAGLNISKKYLQVIVRNEDDVKLCMKMGEEYVCYECPKCKGNNIEDDIHVAHVIRYLKINRCSDCDGWNFETDKGLIIAFFQNKADWTKTHLVENDKPLCNAEIMDMKTTYCFRGVRLEHIECAECKLKAKAILIAEKLEEIEKIKQS